MTNIYGFLYQRQSHFYDHSSTYACQLFLNASFCSFSTAWHYIVTMEYICSYSFVKLLNALPKERHILLPHEGWVSPLSFFLTLTLADPGTMIFPQR